jgi:hypothetical protein
MGSAGDNVKIIRGSLKFLPAQCRDFLTSICCEAASSVPPGLGVANLSSYNQPLNREPCDEPALDASMIGDLAHEIEWFSVRKS